MQTRKQENSINEETVRNYNPHYFLIPLRSLSPHMNRQPAILLCITPRSAPVDWQCYPTARLHKSHSRHAVLCSTRSGAVV